MEAPWESHGVQKPSPYAPSSQDLGSFFWQKLKYLCMPSRRLSQQIHMANTEIMSSTTSLLIPGCSLPASCEAVSSHSGHHGSVAAGHVLHSAHYDGRSPGIQTRRGLAAKARQEMCASEAATQEPELQPEPWNAFWKVIANAIFSLSQWWGGSGPARGELCGG